MQVFVDAAAARQAHLDGAPVFLMHQAHAALKHVLSEVATAEQEPSLAAATAAATALAAAHKALAGEALLASLTLRKLALLRWDHQISCASTELLQSVCSVSHADCARS